MLQYLHFSNFKRETDPFIMSVLYIDCSYQGLAYMPGVANPRLASRMRLFAQFHAALFHMPFLLSAASFCNHVAFAKA